MKPDLSKLYANLKDSKETVDFLEKSLINNNDELEKVEKDIDDLLKSNAQKMIDEDKAKIEDIIKKNLPDLQLLVEMEAAKNDYHSLIITKNDGFGTFHGYVMSFDPYYSDNGVGINITPYDFIQGNLFSDIYKDFDDISDLESTLNELYDRIINHSFTDRIPEGYSSDSDCLLLRNYSIEERLIEQSDKRSISIDIDSSTGDVMYRANKDFIDKNISEMARYIRELQEDLSEHMDEFFKPFYALLKNKFFMTEIYKSELTDKLAVREKELIEADKKLKELQDLYNVKEDDMER